jgi:hypothetical protein
MAELDAFFDVVPVQLLLEELVHLVRALIIKLLNEPISWPLLVHLVQLLVSI